MGDQSTALVRSALAFAALTHAGERRESDGAPFISHPSEVAQLLRDAGCSDVVVAAGLLHDTIDGTRVTVARLATLFDQDVASLVEAVSKIRPLRPIASASTNCASEFATLGATRRCCSPPPRSPRCASFLTVRRNHERCDTTAPTRHSRTRDRLERSLQLRAEHYHASLQMLQDVAPDHPLVKRLAGEFGNSPIAIRRGMTGRGT